MVSYSSQIPSYHIMVPGLSFPGAGAHVATNTATTAAGGGPSNSPSPVPTSPILCSFIAASLRESVPSNTMARNLRPGACLVGCLLAALFLGECRPARGHVSLQGVPCLNNGKRSAGRIVPRLPPVTSD